MNEDSFDPRNWAKSASNLPAPAADKQHPSSAITPEASQSNSSTDSALPEAWRDIAASAMENNSETTRPQHPIKNHNFARYAPILASFLLVLGGGLAAWTTRQLPPETQTPALQAATTPNMVERRVVLASASDIAAALIAADVPPNDANAAAAAIGKTLTQSGEIQLVFQLLAQEKGFLLSHLQVTSSDGSGAVVNRNSSGSFDAAAVSAELTKEIKILRGELDSDSFYSSAVAAGLVDTLIPEFINAFSYDFNLASEISAGDTFEVAYEQSVDASGRAVGQPALLFASLTTKEKSMALYRFLIPGGEVGWFDGNGASTKRGLMRTPVDGARITSKFGMRFHPVLHYNKMHKGTDFAAPIGTPIFAAKDGVIEWAAMKGANGNLTIIAHGEGIQTYYLHQNMFMPGITAGAHVIQGQKIGEIGTTGRSTGPHLHYELHNQGEPVDPLSVVSDDNQRKKLEGAGMQSFITQRNRVDVARSNQVG